MNAGGHVVETFEQLIIRLERAAEICLGIFAAQRYFVFLNLPREKDAARSLAPVSGGSASGRETAPPARESPLVRPVLPSDKPAGNVRRPGRFVIETEGFRFEVEPGGRTIILDGMTYEGIDGLPPEAGCPGPFSAASTQPHSVTLEGDGDIGLLTVTNTFPNALTFTG